MPFSAAVLLRRVAALIVLPGMTDLVVQWVSVGSEARANYGALSGWWCAVLLTALGRAGAREGVLWFGLLFVGLRSGGVSALWRLLGCYGPQPQGWIDAGVAALIASGGALLVGRFAVVASGWLGLGRRERLRSEGGGRAE